MTAAAINPQSASDNSSPLEFRFGPLTLLIPFGVFAAGAAVLFAVLGVFDLNALAALGFASLALGAVFARRPADYFAAALEGAATRITATVMLLLMAAGIFSAMMKASGLAQVLAMLAGGALTGTPLLPAAVLLLCALLATASGSSIATILAAAPIFVPLSAALGVDPALAAGAVLSGAVFGDNLSPVSDVAIISAMTQRDARGMPLDIARVVRTRLPFALAALLLALPFYAVGTSGSGAAAEIPQGNPAVLVMLIPVAVLLFAAARTRCALTAATLAAAVGLALGLGTGVLAPETVVRIESGAVAGILTDGVSGVSGIVLLCLTLLSFTGVVSRAGIEKAFLGGRAQGAPSSAVRNECLLAGGVLLATTAFAGVTSAAVAAAGSLADRLLPSVDPYRRAYLLAGFANSLPVMLPFSALALITLGAAQGAAGGDAVTPASLAAAAFYPAALFVVLGLSVLFGFGRPKTGTVR